MTIDLEKVGLKFAIHRERNCSLQVSAYHHFFIVCTANEGSMVRRSVSLVKMRLMSGDEVPNCEGN